jgi:hypothetical protein
MQSIEDWGDGWPLVCWGHPGGGMGYANSRGNRAPLAYGFKGWPLIKHILLKEPLNFYGPPQYSFSYNKGLMF